MRTATGLVHSARPDQSRPRCYPVSHQAHKSRTSELQRLGNILQDAAIKVDSVASTITARSVRAMVEALIDGERRPLVLAELAKGRMRAKIPDLQRALEGRFDSHHALMCRLHLDHLDYLDEMIVKLPNTQIEDMMQPFRAQRDLTTIPGIGPFVAAAVISEAGADIAETFPSADQFASWIGVCPGNHESAGKRHSGKPRKGNQHLQHVLVECAWAASRTPGYLQSHYRWHVRKFGGSRNATAKNKAIVAVAHKLAIIIWHVLAGKPYADLGADYFDRRIDPRQKPADSSPDSRPSDTPSPSNPQPKTTQRSNPAPPDGFALPGHPRFTYQATT